MRRSEARAVARLARRTARREWRRTALIGTLVAVPVMVAVTVAGLMRAAEMTPEERATIEMGAADIRVHMVGVSAPGAAEFVTTMAELIEDVEARDRLRYRDAWLMDTGEEALDDTRVVDLPLDAPLSEGMFAVAAGRAPSSKGEVALSPSLLDRLEADVGDSISFGHVGTVTVVGRVASLVSTRQDVAALVPDDLDRLLAASPDDPLGWTWLLGGVQEPEQVAQGLLSAYDEATQDAAAQAAGGPAHQEPTAEGAGSAMEEIPVTADVTSRPTLLHQHASPQPGLERVMTPQVVATLVASVLLAEVALIAGAAYATGARRRLRELGLLGANGATATHLRAAVVGEAVVTGVAGALAGIVAGVAMLAWGRPLIQRLTHTWLTGSELSGTDVVGPAVAAVLAVSLAAWLPARTAAHVPTTTALQGRMPLSEPKRWIVPVGVVIAGFGASLLVVGLLADGSLASMVAAIGVLLAILGTAMLTIPLIALAGRVADRLPVTLRLVVRDSARQRTRAAAASASAMVVLIAPVLIATMSLSQQRQNQVNGLAEPSTHVFVPPPGTTSEPTMAGDAPPGQEEVLATIDDVLGGAVRTQVQLLDARAEIAALPPFDAMQVSEDMTDHFGIEATGPEDEAFWWAGGRAAYVALGTAELAEAVDPTGGVAAALDEGRPVVLGLAERDTSVAVAGERVTAAERPVAVLRYGFPRVLVPEDLLDDLGLAVAATGDLFVADAPVDERTRMQLYRGTNGAGVHVGSTWPEEQELFRWLAVAATFAVALVILALVTMLSATESDRDLRTMVAVGAAPRTRRRFLGLQATMHAVVGAALAIPLALALAWATASSGEGFMMGPFGAVSTGAIWLDWPILAAVLLGVPMVIGMVIALLVRSAPTVPPRRLG